VEDPIENIQEIAQNMEKYGLQSDAVIYTAMVNAYMNKGMMEEASNVLEKMDKAKYILLW